jgi:hypothetical protein
MYHNVSDHMERILSSSDERRFSGRQELNLPPRIN